MKTFNVNGTEYRAREFDFNMICDMEDMGVTLEDIQRKPMSMVRAYLAICSGKGNQFAGKEMEKHIVGGGNFDGIMEVITSQMNESDFFRSLNQGAETETPEIQTEEKPEDKTE